MIGKCISAGLRASRRRLALIWLLWCWVIIPAALAALPAWIWLGQAFNLSPESDRLLSGFSLVTMLEAANYDRTSVGAIVGVVFAGIALLVLIANPLASGGLIEVLKADEKEPVLQKFFSGAGHFFWRYFCLLVYALVSGAILLGVLSAIFKPISKLLADSAWEPAGFVSSLIRGAIGLAVMAFVSLSLDYARVRVALEDTKRTWRTWLSTMRFVFKHLTGTYGILLVMVLLFLAAAALYYAICTMLESGAWPALLAVVLLQQALMWARAGLRTAMVASEIQFYRFSCPQSLVETVPEPALEAAPPEIPEPVPESPSEAGKEPDLPSET